MGWEPAQSSLYNEIVTFRESRHARSATTTESIRIYETRRRRKNATPTTPYRVSRFRADLCHDVFPGEHAAEIFFPPLPPSSPRQSHLSRVGRTARRAQAAAAAYGEAAIDQQPTGDRAARRPRPRRRRRWCDTVGIPSTLGVLRGGYNYDSTSIRTPIDWGHGDVTHQSPLTR